MAKSERWEKGAAKMKQLFGAEPRPGTMHEDFLQITVENLFGDIWNRPGLELRERSLITVAALTVLARERELKVHLRGALNAGISREKINEIMIHLAHYGGWPVGVNGLRIAKELFDEIDSKNKQ
ncbi:MAG TPA: carboxymuconolactone decarboxylase family protein [Candidatus Binatia bacterium]|jgi:4-carboxymuconolactone decarboxylase|nr:carboxymuconolactone decarboxylase family protein [Candidatus Binatia bacterium]